MKVQGATIEAHSTRVGDPCVQEGTSPWMHNLLDSGLLGRASISQVGTDQGCGKFNFQHSLLELPDNQLSTIVATLSPCKQ